MRTPEEDIYQLGELARKLANLIRIGKIVEVDYAKARAKVKLGPLTTNFLPWLIGCAGSDQSWQPLDVGEQVLVLAPNGELNCGVIIPSLYQVASPAPTNSKNKHVVLFSDGSKVEFDKETSSLSLNIKGNINITVAGNANITAKQTTITGNATITGNVVLAGGGPAVARAGDKVSVDPATHQGTILSGSSKVSAG